MPMKNPVHPGRIVRHDCLEPLGLSITAGAKILGVSRQTLNKIVNGKSGITPEMAIRLTKAFGSTEETWLRMQLAYDLAAARRHESKIKVNRQHIPQNCTSSDAGRDGTKVVCSGLRSLFLCFLAIAVPLSRAQPQTGSAGPAFDVASIKPNSDAASRPRMRNLPGGRFEATAATLQALVRQAFGVHDLQISGVRGWIGSERFDMVAKTEGAPAGIPEEQSRQMLQALLADRFRLKTHKELKEMAVYALVVGPNGARLTPLAGEPRQTVPTGQGSAVLRTLTLSGLARALSSASGRLVIDETHLSGEYEIVLEFEPEVPFARSIEGMGDSMFAAVQKQLGLKLVPRRAPVEVIVIDQAERPTAN